MSCFSHQGFLGGGGGGEGGGHGILPMVVGYAMRGGQGKNTPNNRGGGFQKMQGKKSEITIAPLYINYESSLKVRRFKYSIQNVNGL